MAESQAVQAVAVLWHDVGHVYEQEPDRHTGDVDGSTSSIYPISHTHAPGLLVWDLNCELSQDVQPVSVASPAVQVKHVKWQGWHCDCYKNNRKTTIDIIL